MKGNKINLAKSIISQKCPKCRQGDLFTHGAYNLKSFAKMPDRCSCCNQKFEIEPSFYFGAMFISYGMQVALFTTVWVAFSVLGIEADYFWKATTIIAIVFVLLPITLRLSRSIWIHIFIRYDDQISCADKQE